MEKIVCKICGKEFEYKKLSSCRAQMTNHLKKDHRMTMEEYQVQYELNGIHPKCLCGCGQNVTWDQHSWRWHKYAADSHVGKVHNEYAAIIKNNMLAGRKVTRNLEDYYRNKYDEKIAKSSVQDFLSKMYTLSELSEKYQLDKRTLKKMWVELNLIDLGTYNEIISYLKYQISSNKNKDKNLLNCSIYTWVYYLIKEHPQKYTISSAIDEYNKNNIEKIITTSFVFYRQMKEIYGDCIDLFLAKGYHSKEEYEFYQILKFFFPKLKIKIGFTITKERYSPIYDICINDEYIIEYDSTGSYHKSLEVQEKDRKKEELALTHGFKFKRLTFNDIHNINILNEIQSWLNL